MVLTQGLKEAKCLALAAGLVGQISTCVSLPRKSIVEVTSKYKSASSQKHKYTTLLDVFINPLFFVHLQDTYGRT